MEGYHTEEQQVEAFKEFWNKNRSLIMSACLAIAVIFAGSKYYFHHQEVQAKQAGLIYNNMVVGMQKNDQETVKAEGEKLIAKYKSTPYFQLGSVLLAKMAVDENKLEEALKYLETVTQQKTDTPLYHVATARMARILHATGKNEEALALLNRNKANGYQTLYDSITGDVYLTMNKPEQAKKAYLSAYANAPENITPPYLKLKLMELGVDNVDELVNKEKGKA